MFQIRLKKITTQAYVVITFCALLTSLIWVIFSPSDSVLSTTPFLVREGESIKVVSIHLHDEGYIRSSLLFRSLLFIVHQDVHIRTGQYFFPEKSSLFTVVYLFISGPQKPLASITIPEGSTDGEIAKIIHAEVPTISEKDIITAIHDESASGFLFPDTYHLEGTETAQDIVERMMNLFALKYTTTFKERLNPRTMITDTKVRHEVSLAAILEKEAKNEADMKIVSGILLHRLRLGMPLQVDAAKETYVKAGLPEPPIANPGLIALQAAKEPTETQYLYYITGKDGTMHYAKTYEEHKKNIRNYLH